MSSKAYQEAYRNMTEKQKDIMHDLYMKAVNHDGHSWNMFCDIEDAVAEIVKEQQWIMRTEDLPKVKQRVMVALKDGSMAFRRCIDAGHLEWFYSDIIAWKPAPQPPYLKGECNERAV